MTRRELIKLMCAAPAAALGAFGLRKVAVGAPYEVSHHRRWPPDSPLDAWRQCLLLQLRDTIADYVRVFGRHPERITLHPGDCLTLMSATDHLPVQARQELGNGIISYDRAAALMRPAGAVALSFCGIPISWAWMPLGTVRLAPTKDAAINGMLVEANSFAMVSDAL
jgi:hypothetical protein